MKKLLLLLLLTTTFAMGQYGDHNTKVKTFFVEGYGPLTIDALLYPYVVEFENDALARGGSIVPELYTKVDRIKIDWGMDFPMMGYNSKSRKLVLVAPHTFVEELAVRYTLYHELAHILSERVGHSCDTCDHAMTAYGPKSYAKFADPKVWEKFVDEIFQWIKAEPEKKF